MQQKIIKLSNLSLDEYLSNETSYTEVLKDDQNVQQVPLLNYANLQNFTDNTLVRFRGMVQDMQDPEMYLESYEVNDKNSSVRMQDGRYRDVLVLRGEETVSYESPKNSFGERKSFFLVSIPGLNDWAAAYERNQQQSITTSTARSGETSRVSKRSNDDDDAMDTIDQNTNKRMTTAAPEQPTATVAALSAEYLLNSPLPDRPSRACIVKVYTDFESFTLNSMVEIIGFLSVDPCLDGSSQEVSEFEDMTEIQAANPPPSLIPRLHAIIVQPLTHYNPMLFANPSPLPEMNDSVYKDLLLVLTQSLFGDTLAAEYLLCHLISTVYVQSELQTLGQFSMNLSNIPAVTLPAYTEQLYELLALVVPVSHLIPLTLDNLNTLQFVPKKDYTTNKLTSGVLQLAPHTNLVLDETRLLAGRLEQAGVEAVASIARLIKTQKLKSNFQFYELEYNANVPVLCLSEGKSMLPTDCHVPIRPQADCIQVISETIVAAKHFLQPKLDAIRMQLTAMKLKEFNSNPDIMEMIQTDFVEMRRIDNKVGVEDLHSLLVLSRLLGLCNGRSCLDADMWQRAKALEQQRKERIVIPTIVQ